MSKTKIEKKTVFRSSETGQFVTKREAERNPRTTERERVGKNSN